MSEAKETDSAIDTFIRYMDVWGCREPGTLEKIKEFHHPTLTGIGTARHQIFRTVQEMEEEWELEVEQITDEKYDVNWIDEIKIDESNSVVYCEVVWKRELKRNVDVTVLHRISSFWKKT